MADLCAQSRAHTYYCTALLHLSRNASRLSGYRSIQQVSEINATNNVQVTRGGTGMFGRLKILVF